MAIDYCFYNFDFFEIFDEVKYVKEVHKKLLKKICEEYALNNDELIEIKTLTLNNLDERAKAYMVKNAPSIVILFVWDTNLSTVSVPIVNIEPPVEIYDYVYEEEMKLLQCEEKIEFVWELTTWDDTDYNDHLTATSKKGFVFDKTTYNIKGLAN